MSGLAKGLAVAAAAAAVCMAPMLIVAAMLPSQTAHGFFAACTQVRGARADILPDPPPTAPTPDQVLLRIASTAATLGVGRQGATVAVAISLRATGLTNAANPNVPDTERYAHSTETTGGVGALGLPASWGTVEELMTPEVSTALVIDRMLDLIPRWRDTHPADLAARILDGVPADFTSAVTAAQTRLDTHPAPSAAETAATYTPVAVAPVLPQNPPAPSGTVSTTRPALTDEQAVQAAHDSPDTAACAAALTTLVPAPAPGPNPHGAALAAAAQRAVGTPPGIAEAAPFVATIAAQRGIRLPDTLAEQFNTGWAVDEPAPGDLVFTDISADHGPHLVGIAVAVDTMVTVLPGHPNPEWTRIGVNRIVRRIEVTAP